eukprot:PhF_6_TR38997/c0_g1_i1/m.58359
MYEPSPPTKSRSGQTPRRALPKTPRERQERALEQLCHISEKFDHLDSKVIEEQSRLKAILHEKHHNDEKQAELLRRLIGEFDEMAKRGIDTKSKFRWSREAMQRMLEVVTTKRPPFRVARRLEDKFSASSSTVVQLPKFSYDDVVGEEVDWTVARGVLQKEPKYRSPTRSRRLRMMIAERHADGAATDIQRVARGFKARKERRLRENKLQELGPKISAVCILQRWFVCMNARKERRRRAEKVAELIELANVRSGLKLCFAVFLLRKLKKMASCDRAARTVQKYWKQYGSNYRRGSKVDTM